VLAEVLSTQDRYLEAESELMDAVALERAERATERALELAPNDDGALSCYGLMWSERSAAAKRLPQKLKFLRRAARSFQEALKLNPANQLAKENLHMAPSQIKGARKHFWQLAMLLLLGALGLRDQFHLRCWP
jgi:tetratricopeptide (TPR) repeat protein